MIFNPPSSDSQLIHSLIRVFTGWAYLAGRYQDPGKEYRVFVQHLDTPDIETLSRQIIEARQGYVLGDFQFSLETQLGVARQILLQSGIEEHLEEYGEEHVHHIPFPGVNKDDLRTFYSWWHNALPHYWESQSPGHMNMQPETVRNLFATALDGWKHQKTLDFLIQSVMKLRDPSAYGSGSVDEFNMAGYALLSHASTDMAAHYWDVIMSGQDFDDTTMSFYLSMLGDNPYLLYMFAKDMVEDNRLRSPFAVAMDASDALNRAKKVLSHFSYTLLGNEHVLVPEDYSRRVGYSHSRLERAATQIYETAFNRFNKNTL